MAPQRQSKRVAANAAKGKTGPPAASPNQLSRDASKERLPSGGKTERVKSATPIKSEALKQKDKKSVQEDWIELPHGLGKQLLGNSSQNESDGEIYESTNQNNTMLKTENTSSSTYPDITERVRKRKAPYGLTPGTSPYPDYTQPTAKECEEVHRLLTTIHGPRLRPKTMPKASATVTGCGQVPFVLDAVLRTLLSATTTARNSAIALQGLISTFGSIDNSPDWNAVRKAPLPAVIESIKRGGLANVKATNIKAILDAVYERNVKDAAKMKDNKSSIAPTLTISGSKEDVVGQNPLLRIDYISKMNDEDAMNELITLPGIGVKTAACVLMFNMGRDVFAVDTHIYRICQWLGWVPETKGMSRDKAFSHLEIRIPNHLKYPLHQQLIYHGRECLRCKASTSPNTPGWDDAACPIEKLVKRTGPMKSGKRGTVKGEKGQAVFTGRVTKAKATTRGGPKRRGKGKRVVEVDSDETEMEDVLADVQDEE